MNLSSQPAPDSPVMFAPRIFRISKPAGSIWERLTRNLANILLANILAHTAARYCIGARHSDNCETQVSARDNNNIDSKNVFLFYLPIKFGFGVDGFVTRTASGVSAQCAKGGD